jgi:uncharacterized membrane protein
MMKTQRVILIALISMSVLQIMYYYPQLPETVASHFDINGNPNGCSSKGLFIGTYIFVMFVTLCSFLILPSLFKYVPVSLISLPNKNYWLSPERKGETFRLITEKMLSFGNATTLFLIITFQLAFEANLNPASHFSSDTMAVLFGGFIVFTIVWTVTFIARFRKADKQ